MGATDTIHRRLCHTLFDALERSDVATIADCYAPGMTMWCNVTGQVTTREENLAAIEQGASLHRRRTYDDRQIHTFDDGFVAQYTCRVVAKDGTVVPLSACLVAEVHGGRIVTLMEYIDSARFTPKRKR